MLSGERWLHLLISVHNVSVELGIDAYLSNEAISAGQHTFGGISVHPVAPPGK